MRRFVAVVLLTAALAPAACTRQGAPGTPGAPTAMMLVGAGSTFDYPFFSRAFYQYSLSHPGVTVNYQSIGSGGGIQQFTKRTVDFGATDVPMGAKDLGALGGGASAALQIPITLGGLAIAYNVPGAPVHMRLSSDVVARIFMGDITSWADPAIATLNPGTALQNLPILVVHRADGSGSTYIFTDYLSSVSARWKHDVGKGKTVAWPARSAVGAKGTEGEAGQIRNTPGAIGYIELAYATQNGIAFAALQNVSGAFVVPTIDSVRAAAAAKPAVSAADFSIVNERGAGSYPIAGYSWVLLYKKYPEETKRAALYKLFRWMLEDGQRSAAALGYVPLPNNVAASAARLLK